MIREYKPTDRQEWLRMRRSLWPATVCDAIIESRDAEQWLARGDALILVFERGIPSGLGGFLEVGERPFADGCSTSPVGFIEGWYVDAELRSRGIGRALIVEAEKWARNRGYKEIASDSLLEATASQVAHIHLGFTEVERSVRYKKAL